MSDILPDSYKLKTFPRLLQLEFIVIYPPLHLPLGYVPKRDASRATMFSLEVCMEHRALGNSSTAASGSQSSGTHREGRGVWVLTAYGISGLALFGVLVYYFSTYVTH